MFARATCGSLYAMADGQPTERASAPEPSGTSDPPTAESTDAARPDFLDRNRALLGRALGGGRHEGEVEVPTADGQRTTATSTARLAR
jgi:hypothetical protein